MKKVSIKFLIMLIITLAYQTIIITNLAQAPQKISYQAAIRDASNNLIIGPLQQVGVRLSILKGATKDVVYSETHITIPSLNGIVSLQIGGGTAVPGPLFEDIDWSDGPYYISTETDPTGPGDGTVYSIVGEAELISVPYAFYSTTAGNSFSGAYEDLDPKPVTDGSETIIDGGTFVTVTGTGTAASPYVINSNPVTGGFSHYLGEFYDGGIIFHLYKRADGTEHALIVSLTESALLLQSVVSNTDAESFWDGRGNTALYTNSPARTYVEAMGYGWYIPAIDELNLLWQNRYHVNKGLAAQGATLLYISDYWSSTEVTASSLAWNFYFESGNAYSGYPKSNVRMVRGVRGLTTSPTQLTTAAVTDITNITATSGGTLISDEGSPVTARGVCWSTLPNPTTVDSKTVDGSGIGSFTSSITGLSLNVTYYVRAYAINGAGIAYGNEVSFTTAATPPIVTTTAASLLTKISANSGGNVTDDRGDAVTARGVCWSTSPNPTTANSHTTNGGGTGVFSSAITGLITGTTYYVRAYATNGVGTSYGNEISFTTLAVPSVTTDITTTYTSAGNATSGGNVTGEGGVSVTAKGVCWSTSTNPTIADNTTTDGSGPGIYTSTITGLTLGTTYYIRAYATSVEGTSYGNEIWITTLAIGDSYLGGKVGYLDGTGLRGLVVANGDLNSGLNTAWSDNLIAACGATDTDGQVNTNLMLTQSPTAPAAKFCNDYFVGVYTEWYLPSISEMLNIWPNRVAVGIGAATSYWTSNETDSNESYRFVGGASDREAKNAVYKVRAVQFFDNN